MELVDLTALQGLDPLLGMWRDREITATLPDRNDEDSSVRVFGTTAKRLYENGMNLLFAPAERVVTELQPWLDALQTDLGLPSTTVGRCIIYVSPKDIGAGPHFDHNANFVVQLQGCKVWKLAPNHHVVHPHVRFRIGTPASPELVSYCDDLPRSMPRATMTVTLEPGDFLFVPRGYWHTTLASHASISLSFTLSQPSWADVTLEALRRRLLLDPAWRELADGVSSDDPHRRSKVAARLSERIGSLRATLSRISVGDLRSDVEQGDDQWFAIPARTSLEAVRGQIVVRSPWRVERRLRTEPCLVPLLRWIGVQRAPFRVRDIPKGVDGGLSKAGCLSLILRLVRTGGLKRARPQAGALGHARVRE